jgi:glycine betaine/proline transport system substrate-binding protein
MKRLLAFTWFAIGICALARSAQADCGSVSIAEMNWASAGVAANVDKIILEEGYGCTVKLVSGDTMTTFNSMDEKGEPDVAPEFWVNSARIQLNKAATEGRLVIAAEILSDGAVEGWWIPKFVADKHPTIKTVQQALAHPELFPAPGNPAKGAIFNCPRGWNCQVSTTNLYRALGAKEKNFELIETATAAELDSSISNAFANKTGWLGYYWAPTPILGTYEMVKLSFDVPHDLNDWSACTSVANCPNPKVNSYPTSQAFTVVTKRLANRAPDAMEYMKKRKWTNATVNTVLAWQHENRGTNEATAKHFLDTMPDIWTKWLPPAIVEKVRASL